MRDDRPRRPVNDKSNPFQFGSCLTLIFALMIITIIAYYILTH